MDTMQQFNLAVLHSLYATLLDTGAYSLFLRCKVLRDNCSIPFKTLLSLSSLMLCFRHLCGGLIYFILASVIKSKQSINKIK